MSDLTMRDLLDTVAGLSAAQDQAEMAFGQALGLDHGVPLDSVLLVSPDVGMRLARDGKIPDRVRITWMLPPGSTYLVTSELVR